MTLRWAAPDRAAPRACGVSVGTRSRRKRWLADPELVDEHVPVGVVLVVACPGGEEGQVARVVQRYPWCLVGEFAVDGSPAGCGCGGVAGLGCQCALGLGVDLRVAEFRLVDVVGIAGEEGGAGEQRADEVGGRRVVLVPGEEPGLDPVAGVAERGPVAAGACGAQRCPVAEL